MQGKLESQVEQGLTARQIFDKILKGQVVKIGPDPQVAKQLNAHLNVIKSRHKKLFKELGLDFCASVISIEGTWNNRESRASDIGMLKLMEIPPDGYEIKLVAPKQRKTYTVFAIEENEPTTSPL